MFFFGFKLARMCTHQFIRDFHLLSDLRPPTWKILFLKHSKTKCSSSKMTELLKWHIKWFLRGKSLFVWSQLNRESMHIWLWNQHNLYYCIIRWLLWVFYVCIWYMYVWLWNGTWVIKVCAHRSYSTEPNKALRTQHLHIRTKRSGGFSCEG